MLVYNMQINNVGVDLVSPESVNLSLRTTPIRDINGSGNAGL